MSRGASQRYCWFLGSHPPDVLCVCFGVGLWHKYSLFCVSINFFEPSHLKRQYSKHLFFHLTSSMLAACLSFPCADTDGSPLNTSPLNTVSHANKDILLHNHILRTTCSSPLSNIHSTPRFSSAVLDSHFSFGIQRPVKLPLAVMPLGLPQAGTALLCPLSIP